MIKNITMTYAAFNAVARAKRAMERQLEKTDRKASPDEEHRYRCIASDVRLLEDLLAQWNDPENKILKKKQYHE